MNREEKLNKIVLLLEEWEEWCAGNMEEARERAMEIYKIHSDPRHDDLDYLAALRRGEEYIQKANDAKREIAGRILEVV
jgi:hypothetical protein